MRSIVLESDDIFETGQYLDSMEETRLYFFNIGVM